MLIGLHQGVQIPNSKLGLETILHRPAINTEFTGSSAVEVPLVLIVWWQITYHGKIFHLSGLH